MKRPDEIKLVQTLSQDEQVDAALTAGGWWIVACFVRCGDTLADYPVHRQGPYPDVNAAAAAFRRSYPSWH